MAKKNESDTLAQQRKARQDFLDLKKMQQGEMDAGPKPSEIAIKPKTFSEKVKNYWFHFKWHTLGTIFCLIGLIVLVAQCASRTDWDMQVVYFTYTPVLDQQTDIVADYFEGISKDLNGDGEVNIHVVNCSISQKNSQVQYNQTILTKLQTLIAGEAEALLYITDNDSAEYFKTDALKDFFGSEQILLNEEFYNATKSEDFGSLPEGLQIACRRVANTVIEKDKNVGSIYKEANNILAKLEKKQLSVIFLTICYCFVYCYIV